MTPKQIDGKMDRTLAAIRRIESHIEWLTKKVDYRRRRIRELSKLRAEALTMKLPLE